MTTQKKLLAAGALLAFSMLVRAQEPAVEAPANEKAAYHSVVVTASRTEEDVFAVPAFAMAFDQKLIDERQPTSLGDILGDMPNVEFTDAGSPIWQKPSIRGVGDNGVIFLIDGARQSYTSAAGNAPAGGVIDMSMLKHVEVKTGSSSTLYGGGGIGGAILLKTKDASDLLRGGENLGASYNFGFRTALQQTQHSLAVYGQHGKLGVIVQGTYRDFNNVRNTRPGSNNHYERDGDSFSLMTKLSYTPTDKQYLSFSYNYDDLSSQAVPKTSFEASNKQHRLLGNYELSLNDYVDLKATFQAVKRDYDYTNSTVGNQSDEFKSYGFSIQNTTILFKDTRYVNQLTYGVDAYFDHQKGWENGIITDARPDAKSEDIGFFLQDKITFAEIIDLIPAARVTHYSRESKRGLADDMSDTEVTPSVTLQVRPLTWLNIFASYSEAYRPPSMDELYTYIDYGMYGAAVPNPDLKPESAKSWEFGFNINKEGLFTQKDYFGFKFVYFTQKVDDMMDIDIVSFSPLELSYVNIKRGERNGVELMANYYIKGVDLSLAYGKTIGRNKDSGDRAGGAPGKFSGRLAYTFQKINLTPFYKFRYVERYETDTGYSMAEYQPYAVHAIGVTWKPDGWRYFNGYVTASFDNMFDKRYTTSTGSYDLGRSFSMTVGVKF